MIDLAVSSQFLAISNGTHTIAVSLKSESGNVHEFNRTPNEVTEHAVIACSSDSNDGKTAVVSDNNTSVSDSSKTTASDVNTPILSHCNKPTVSGGSTSMECDVKAHLEFNGNTTIISEGNTHCDDTEPIISDGNISIVSSSFSTCGQLFVCCCQKDLSVWDVSNWTMKGKKTIQRSANKVIFSPSNSIIVADKSGDVYLHLLNDFDKPGTLLLGHVSMLLDVLVTPDEKYIITCDRDEKIRVSLYPKPYVIHSYCLGHEDFVTFINLLPHDCSVLVSSGGDGTIRFWNYEIGKQLLIHSFSKDISDFIKGDNQQIVSHRGLVSQFDFESSLLYSSVFKVNAIMVHLVKKSCSGISCTLWQIIKTDYVPICFQISGQDKLLWVLLKDKVKPLMTFKFDTNCYKESDPSDICKLTGILEKYKDLLTDIELHERFINSLAKKRFDNESEYYKRKHERLEKSIVKKIAT